MRKNSFSTIADHSKVMLAGLQANKDRLGKRGIDRLFLENLESRYRKSMEMDNEQEALKARLKEKTAALENELKELEKLLSEAKKTVKLEMPKASWLEFGIHDKR